MGARCLAIRIAASPFPAVVLIAVYAPTATPGKESEVLPFHAQLSAFITSLDSNTPYVILGDLNATLAPNSAKGCRFPTTNDTANLNTPHLTNFILSHNIFTVSRSFQRRCRDLVTFHGPRSRKVALDYICAPVVAVVPQLSCSLASPRCP